MFLFAESVNRQIQLNNAHFQITSTIIGLQMLLILFIISESNDYQNTIFWFISIFTSILSIFIIVNTLFFIMPDNQKSLNDIVNNSQILENSYQEIMQNLDNKFQIQLAYFNQGDSYLQADLLINNEDVHTPHTFRDTKMYINNSSSITLSSLQSTLDIFISQIYASFKLLNDQIWDMHLQYQELISKSEEFSIQNDNVSNIKTLNQIGDLSYKDFGDINNINSAKDYINKMYHHHINERFSPTLFQPKTNTIYLKNHVVLGEPHSEELSSEHEIWILKDPNESINFKTNNLDQIHNQHYLNDSYEILYKNGDFYYDQEVIIHDQSSIFIGDFQFKTLNDNKEFYISDNYIKILYNKELYQFNISFDNKLYTFENNVQYSYPNKMVNFTLNQSYEYHARDEDLYLITKNIDDDLPLDTHLQHLTKFENDQYYIYVYNFETPTTNFLPEDSIPIADEIDENDPIKPPVEIIIEEYIFAILHPIDKKEIRFTLNMRGTTRVCILQNKNNQDLYIVCCNKEGATIKKLIISSTSDSFSSYAPTSSLFQSPQYLNDQISLSVNYTSSHDFKLKNQEKIINIFNITQDDETTYYANIVEEYYTTS